MKNSGRRRREMNQRESLAGLAAIAMLCCFPIVYHDGMFDINRFKVLFVYGTAAVCAVMVLWEKIADGGLKRIKDAKRLKDAKGFDLSSIGLGGTAMICCAASWIVCCALHGFDLSMLTGSNGRYCGMLFLLSCCVIYFVILRGRLDGQKIANAAVWVAAVCAVLGILNAMGIDPLGIYVRMIDSQKSLFLSTIGNVDFFGCYLVILLPMAAAQCAFARKNLLLYGLLTLVIEAGVCASRADIAFLGVQLAFAALVAASGDDLRALGRTFLLWACAWAMLPAMGWLLLHGESEYAYEGILLTLSDGFAAWAAFAVLAALGALCLFLHSRHVGAPGRNRLLVVFLALLALGAAFVIGLMVYFTRFNTEFDLGSLDYALRFSDSWGSRRGFVYTRSMRALADYSPVELLFGKGLEQTRDILTPYFDNPYMLTYGVFNDAHCQPLQFLLSCGLFGSLSVIAFHVLSLCGIWRGAEDGMLTGAFAALFGYTLIAMFSVTQPILIGIYISIAALAASRLQRKGVIPHESGTAHRQVKADKGVHGKRDALGNNSRT